MANRPACLGATVSSVRIFLICSGFNDDLRIAYPKCVDTLLLFMGPLLHNAPHIKFNCLQQMEHGVAGVSIAIILGAPILSNYGLRFGFVENIVVRIFLIGALIFIIQKDVFLGLIAFLAVFTLLLERNHALALDLPNQRNNTSFDMYKASSPVMALPAVETPVTFEEELRDNIPRLAPAPTSAGAVAFFNSI